MEKFLVFLVFIFVIIEEFNHRTLTDSLSMGSVDPTNCVVDNLILWRQRCTFKSILSKNNTRSNQKRKKLHKQSGKNLNGCKAQWLYAPGYYVDGVIIQFRFVRFCLYVKLISKTECKLDKQIDIKPSSHRSRWCGLSISHTLAFFDFSFWLDKSIDFGINVCNELGRHDFFLSYSNSSITSKSRRNSILVNKCSRNVDECIKIQKSIWNDRFGLFVGFQRCWFWRCCARVCLTAFSFEFSQKQNVAHTTEIL